jgi:hypothetical protein
MSDLSPNIPTIIAKVLYLLIAQVWSGETDTQITSQSRFITSK